jgi:hypothetical protein
MGEIIRTKTTPQNKIKLYIKLSTTEAKTLKNHAKKIHIFSENLCTHETKIIQRGAKNGAKYAMIPLSLKTRKKPKFSKITYQKLETKNKTFYIATAEKDPLSEEN